MPSVLSMSTFNPEELVDVARDLIKNYSESKIRTICNRCYYSCHLTIKQKKNKIDATNKLGHKEAYEYIQSLNQSALKRYYYRLHRCRVASDYGLHSYQTGLISESIPGEKFPVDLEDEQTGLNAIKYADEFLRIYKNI